jgi:hypothetical protein
VGGEGEAGVPGAGGRHEAEVVGVERMDGEQVPVGGVAGGWGGTGVGVGAEVVADACAGN